MTRRCDIDASKKVAFGNRVSHSNRKCRRTFRPNLKAMSYNSELLGRVVRLRVTASTIRTIEHNDGFDNYLLTTPASKLTTWARRLKKDIEAKKAA
jgi:large subunit ribosomal protein L28